MAGQPPGSGFNQHVWSQLNDYANQSSQQHRGRGRGYPRGPRSRGGPQNLMTSSYHQTDTSFQSPPPSIDAFPPLGSQPPPQNSPHSLIPSPRPFAQPQSRGSGYGSRPQHRGSFNYSADPRVSHQQTQNFPVTSPVRQQFPQPQDEFRRPVASVGTTYHPSHPPQFSVGMYGNLDPTERTFRQQVMEQSDYLNRIQKSARQKYQLKKEEQLRKECFRKALELMFQNLLVRQFPTINADEVRLKCYGSLNNGFGLADCDMDLLLALPDELDFINKAALVVQTEEDLASTKQAQDPDSSAPAQGHDSMGPSDETTFEVARLLEGALLDSDIGARLLTKTRVPILRVCEKPSDELLDNLREYRKESVAAAQVARAQVNEDILHTPPDMSMTEILSALSELSAEDAAQVILPGSPPKSKQPALEFVGDCGIQCDINFTNFVAVHNTKLLREYCQYDSRVGEIGTFVKAWAKIRDINTPYLGTLSSYGYILMVLHYLMNVVQPPVIPNLQHLAYSEDSWASRPPQKFEDKFDVRFWQDSEKLREFKVSQPRNRESTGHLLRGFFWYYSAREGFNFKNDIVSIRSRGGVLRKANKGWTEAKWSNQKKNVRQRYLLAIEDPFEIDHNVARVVGHNGIVAIRDEFRRAWTIISAVGGPNPPTEELLEPAIPRGDLLRKDQDHHRERMKVMKQEMEARHKQALQEGIPPAQNANGVAVARDVGEIQAEVALQENGMFKQPASCSEIPPPPAESLHRRRSPKNTQLTNEVGVLQDKFRQHRRGRLRKVKAESDEDIEGERRSKPAQKLPLGVSLSKNEIEHLLQCGEDQGPEPFCSPSEISRSQGYDVMGNPVAWDITTQDGRWLRWRDNKIRQGTWIGPKRPNLVAHDRRYPYDPRRPAPAGGETLKLANELRHVSRPPYPLNKVPAINSTEGAIAANILKPLYGDSTTSIHKNWRFRKASARRPIVSEPDFDPSVTEPAGRTVLDLQGSRALPSDSTCQPEYSSEARSWQVTASNNGCELSPQPKTVIEPWLGEEAENSATSLSSPQSPVPLCTPDVAYTETPNHWQQGLHSLEVPRKAVDAVSNLCATTDCSTKCNRLISDPHRADRYQHYAPRTTFEMNSADLIESDHLNNSECHTGRPRYRFITRVPLAPPSTNKDVDSSEESLQYSLLRGKKQSCPAVDLILSSVQRTASKPNATDPSREGDSETMPDSAFIRSRRLAYYAAKEKQEILFQPKSDEVQDVARLMKDTGIGLGNCVQFRSHYSSSESYDCLGGKHSENRKLCSGDSTVSHRQTPLANPFDLKISGLTQTSAATEQDFHDAHQESLQVPLSLYPELTPENRALDEDPLIMPIPRELGFKFDVRQLRDLAVIKEGGNGCAVEGYEFEIQEEDNDEWIGSGAVDWTKSTKQEAASTKHESASARYEYGKGDEEYLLGELPGPDI